MDRKREIKDADGGVTGYFEEENRGSDMVGWICWIAFFLLVVGIVVAFLYCVYRGLRILVPLLLRFTIRFEPLAGRGIYKVLQFVILLIPAMLGLAWLTFERIKRLARGFFPRSGCPQEWCGR